LILNEEKMSFLNNFSSEDLEEIFSVSKVTLTRERDSNVDYSNLDYVAELKTPTDYKCVRCWKFTSKVEHHVCERCDKVLQINS